MRKAFRHTGVLMMVAVVALGLLGAAYTLWYEKLTVVTNITTGTLDADLSFHAWSGSGETFTTANGNGSGKPVVAILPNATAGVGVLENQGASHLLGSGGSGSGAKWFTNANFPVGKPQPACSGALTNPDADGGASTLTLTANGLYPFAGCAFTIDIENNGSVPFHLGVVSQNVTCNSGPCPSSATNLPWTRGVVKNDANTPWSQTSDYDKCVAFFNADWKGTVPQQINYPNGPSQTPTDPVQIHNGTPLTCTFMLVLDENWRTTEYPADTWQTNQGLSFTVTTKYVAYQWNEAPNLSDPYLQ